jgi:hypothetical protein
VKTVVMSAGPDDVCDVIVNGRLLLHKRAFVHLDEERIRRQAGEALLRIGRKAGLKLNDPFVN